jgi:hypothetical protein
MEIIGKNWYSVSPVAEFKTGEGVIIDFTFTQGSYFEMVVDNGNFGTDQYKRFGILIYYNYPKTDVWNGQNWLGGAILTGNFIPRPDTTYSLLLAILPEGDFLGVLWNPVDPTQMFYYREKLGKAWSDLAWAYRIGANNGKILFDNYRVIKFDGAK